MNDQNPLKIKIIIGTTRQNRFSEKAASYIYQEAQKREEMDVELLDLRDFPLPFYNEPVSPSMFALTNHEYADEYARKWTNKIGEGDGFIMVTAEYNHGYPAVLKNAIDYVFKEWNKKVVGFVGYGNAGGARAIEQLREVAVELQLVPIRSAIHIPPNIYMSVKNETLPVNPDLFQSLHEGKVDRVEAFFSDFVWTTRALKKARQGEEK